MDERTVLTTGANSGIGLATAILLARNGFRSVGSVRSRSKAEVVRRAAADAGVTVEAVLLDVTDAAACERVMKRVKPWGLVNNAGSSFSGAVEDVTDEEARASLETMVIAPMRLSRLALAPMRAAGGGRIVNVSSIYGLTTTPLTGWYQAAKHAIEALSDALRMEVAQDGIRIVLVEPGGVKTGIWDMAETDMQGRAGSRYRTSYERSLGGIRLSQPFMADPNAVARVIARALGARSPRPRYLVGSTRRWPRRSTSSCPRPSRTASRGWRVICSAASDERTLLRVGPYSL
ncbi:MAG TPA: oxidoreductase [Actinobacteria bacterium]|nr:oxidoreductase [Actinomycetota bacterium]